MCRPRPWKREKTAAVCYLSLEAVSERKLRTSASLGRQALAIPNPKLEVHYLHSPLCGTVATPERGEAGARKKRSVDGDLRNDV